MATPGRARQGSPNEGNKKTNANDHLGVASRQMARSLWLPGWIAAAVGVREGKHRPRRRHSDSAVICWALGWLAQARVAA